MSLAQAAALAAFKGMKDKETKDKSPKKDTLKSPIRQTPKQNQKPKIDALPNIPKSHKRTTSVQSLKVKTSPVKKPIRSIYDVKDLNLNGSPTQLNNSVASLAASASFTHKRNISIQSNDKVSHNNFTTPIQKQHSRTLSQVSTPVSTISGSEDTVRPSIDYFSLSKDSLYAPEMKKSSSNHSNLNISHERAQEALNNVKSSIQAKSIGKDPSLKRRSDTAPHDMLSRMKQSIADKSSNVGSSPKSKNDMINGIRESIELKMITTSVNHFYGFDDYSDNNELNHSESDNNYYHPPNISNGSYTSLGSSILFILDQSNNRSNNTSQRQNNEDEMISVKSSTPVSETPVSATSIPPAIFMTDFDEGFTQPVQPTKSSTSRGSKSGSTPGSPILIPSLGANAREAALGSNENVNHINPRFKFQSFDSTKTMSDESIKSQLKRKPPPIIDSVDNSSHFNSRSLFDYSVISDNDATDSSSRLPQFPDIEKKHNQQHLHNPFKKKKKLDYIDLSNLDNDTDPLYTSSSSRPTTPMLTHQNQPVQLKTTMRKAKSSKKTFNEEKPWKNHTDLVYITEQERKRYEGVWVSNKGLYINKVVTKLIGVDYNGNNSNEEDHKKEETKKEDPSMQAAKLSSSQHDNIEDFESFHSLKKVDIDQLIVGSVVKRLWSRSKLPNETLENIWDLVDYRKDGTLNKAEFLVGMWMVDQCLYGRKLPKKIDNETWSSLESIGLNIQVKKRGKRSV